MTYNESMMDEAENEAVIDVPEEKDPLADLFEPPQPEDNDMVVDHLIAAPDEETEDDMGDLLDVSVEDIMGEAPPPPRVRRVLPKPFFIRGVPPAGMSGIR